MLAAENLFLRKQLALYLERKKRRRQATDAVGFTMNCARSLRENIRLLIEKRKAGQRGYATVLNGFLANAQSDLQLVWRKPGQLRIETVRRQNSPAAILGPVAESAADLLATADFRFVKRCESETCVLWFSDQTEITSSTLVQHDALREPPQGRSLRRRRNEGGCRSKRISRPG